MVDGSISQQTGSQFQKNAQQMLLGKKSNVLLARDDVGKAKPSTRNLPAADFAFGKGNKFDEGAGESKSIIPIEYLSD